MAEHNRVVTVAKADVDKSLCVLLQSSSIDSSANTDERSSVTEACERVLDWLRRAKQADTKLSLSHFANTDKMNSQEAATYVCLKVLSFASLCTLLKAASSEQASPLLVDVLKFVCLLMPKKLLKKLIQHN